MIETCAVPHETYEQNEVRMEKLKPFFEMGLGSQDNHWMEWTFPKYCERRWYITDQGYVGIGTEDLQVGDVVAMLWGLDKACILRPVQEDEMTEGGTRQHRFIGAAYCRGAEEVVLKRPMDGTTEQETKAAWMLPNEQKQQMDQKDLKGQ
ncbi:uncharacterized protein MYCFIDRAFT_170370 [Pseudocercospora fijiensis CIRAD86]|uniref:Uncharacterized protein n=1 Tax=Pseudocercospora fijiensis (strain CIRAD86) TaxID=383855 RepID=N1Q7S2_PSEFD|nr:uncharacterized protein MYCFIDRAFT_170370 [Pseudocercospora fijiensis CIRAD86]EME88795.1 hypothetical protein MYCFIDRAFT_170370 [Pseudocercospora fijiensis CIRAD86]